MDRSNLKALLPQNETLSVEDGPKRKRRKKRNESMDIKNISEQAKEPSVNAVQHVLSSDDEFASLSLNRIVLKRAQNVSDEGSDSD